MEAQCYNNQPYTEPAFKIKYEIGRSTGILRLVGRYKVAFLFFLTRLLLINCILFRYTDCIRNQRANSPNTNSIKIENNVISNNFCKIFNKPFDNFNTHSRYKMNRLSRIKHLSTISNFKALQVIKYSFVNNINNVTSINSLYKYNDVNEIKEGSITGLGRMLKAYDPQTQSYTSTYQSNYTVSPNYGTSYTQHIIPREDFNTFVSSHYRNMGEDIVEYLNRKKIEYTESPIKYTLKFCPFCPPHRFKSDNLFKHEIFKNSGNSYCHRCGYKGSLFDFKAHMGDLPGAFDMASDPISNPFGQKKVPKDPDVTIEDVNKFEDNLFNNQDYRAVYDYLTKTRGIKPQVLRKYHVGAGTFKFKSITGKLEPEKCVVFPWLTSVTARQSVIGEDGVSASDEVEVPMNRSDSGTFDYNQNINDKLTVNRIKIRSIYDKSKIKILPRGGTWGMFGCHLLGEASEKDSIVLSEGEFDAMSIYQETGRIAASLPNGANSLPLALLPKLEKFNQIYLWMDFDAAGQSSISHFANKLGIQRVKIVHPIKTSPASPIKNAAVSGGDKGAGGKVGSVDARSGAGSTIATKGLKDANEIMLSKSVDMETYFKAATVMSHSQILSFNDIRQLVYNELSDPITTCGIKSLTMPGLSNLLKGHRRGELTVWTGSTGSGKTTLLSQLSLDYCLQGVSTLWGSFEINNVRLAKTMLRQFSGRNLENNLNEFDYYANKFNELPLRFLKFHGSTNIDIVLDAMDYAVYVHDVQHIIIDNLQFMLSNYSTPSGSHTGTGYNSIKDVYELQNRTIEKFRRFVTNKNVHLSLVVHPRKEADGIQLGLSSVFGSVKSTQEADNVIILQNILNESRCIDVKKNRFAGLLGRVYFKFDPVSLTAQEFKVTEYLNEYISNNNGNSGSKGSRSGSTLSGANKEQSKSDLANKGSYDLRDRVILSNYKVASTKLSATTSTSSTGDSSPNLSYPGRSGTNVANGGAVGNKTSTTTRYGTSTSFPAATAYGEAQTGSASTATGYAASASHASGVNVRPLATSPINSGSTANTGYSYYRDKDRNSIGLVGIDLLNLNPISHQINKMMQSNYSTSSNSGGSMSTTSSDNNDDIVTRSEIHSDNIVNELTKGSMSADDSSGITGDHERTIRFNENGSLVNDGINSMNDFGNNDDGNNNSKLMKAISGTADSGNVNGSENDTKKKKTTKKKGKTVEEEEDLDCLKMRGLTINKNSSIKEMREFVKKNGLGELVKTAGKGLKKDTIYENIKAVIPQSAVITGGSKGLTSSEGVEAEGKVSVMDEVKLGEEVYPFGVSTSRPLLRRENQQVYPSVDIEQFKLKYLTKLPKSLYPDKDKVAIATREGGSKAREDGDNDKESERGGVGAVVGDKGESAQEKIGVNTDVYYSVSYDPLLIDGVIYVDEYSKLESLEPLFKKVKLVGVDIETTGLDHNNNKIRLLQMAVPNQPTVIVDLFKIKNNLENSTGGYGNDVGIGDGYKVSSVKAGSNVAVGGGTSDRMGDDLVNALNIGTTSEGTTGLKGDVSIDYDHALLRCSWLRRIFRSEEVTKVFHNGKFDINFMRVYGFEFDGPIFDTMIASKILVASRYISCKLTHVSERYLNIVLDKTQQYSDWSTLQLFEEQLLYSARDAFVLLPLYVILEHLLKINKLSEIAKVENKCILATSDMELNGIEVDKRKLELLQNELVEEHGQISDKMHQQLKEESINLNSQKQVLEKLQELNIMDKSKKKLISDTSESTLIRNISNPIISTLREYRKANKALTAFTQKLPNHINQETNRIYPNYNQLGAESGRFSCDGPNLQQVPREKKFRECFVASKGNKFVIADFSQIELRIAAEIANDAKMIQAYQQKVDLHSLTASILKNKNINDVTKQERQLAKAVNFGLIFGMSVNGLRMYAETGYEVKLTQKEAKEIYTSFFNNFKGILNWHNTVKNNRPTMVRTLGNRLSVFDSFSFTRSLNYPVQGTSADITKETMARLVDLVKPLDAKIIICIHDEIILEVPESNAQKALDMLIDTMVKSGEKYLKKVPVEAMGSIGDSWAEK